jgi:8-oxo-dGTP pyrophosphatase MutT (NUDIX family)
MDDDIDFKLDETAGGVVVNGQSFLILFLPARQEYRLPKGHIEYGETAAEAALREVSEESGYLDLRIVADLGTHTVKFDRLGKRGVRSEHYFFMSLENEAHRGSGLARFEPRWLSWDEALAQLTFEAEKQWLRRVKPFWDVFLQQNGRQSPLG